VLAWLLGAALGPALVGLPVNWAGEAGAGAAQRWFRRLRRTDDLSRLVRAATGTSIDLTRTEFDAVRRLLLDQQTWTLAGRGTVENLATLIAVCLPSRDGRTADDSQVAARAVARGLLEFGVADLAPEVFQQVLLTRLQRMETDQASALDKALVGQHADLLARLDAQGELDAEHFATIMGQLKRALDRLPPGPADRVEIAVYLRTLIDWLNRDPWPQDRRFDGPVLAPAVIERKLRITATSREGRQDLDADELANRCRRLVVLGGAGSGKTWLAKRTARRCAECALKALTAGGNLDEIELPLYATCSRLFSAHGDIRDASVSSALDQLADLGGSRISAALRMLFAERNAPTVLVIDSLDEAHGSDERLRQADTLPWRIVLTSRPSSWNRQLVIEKGSDSHQVGELQPLRYPDDVEPFIQRWFADRPEQGNDLSAQIARRPSLQQAATVPLILAFYCIVGSGQPLPDFRHDLYAKVLNRMLTGRWRGSDDRKPHVGTCLEALRALAWSGATSHQTSGVGTWADDIPAEHGALEEADEDALDHIATPVGPADVDTGKIPRRFIHRSIREYLVAQHVASLLVDQAAEVLLPHIWYDSDWEYAAPAALAMHPARDQLVRDLICRAASTDRIPADLSVVDAGWQFRRFLARVAAESGEVDWSPEVAEIIGQARVELALSCRFDGLGEATSWRSWNRRARDALLGLLADQTDGWWAGLLATGVVQLAPTAEDRHEACSALLRLIFGGVPTSVAGPLASAVADLGPTAEDRRRVRAVLVRALARQTNGDAAAQLADRVVELDPTAEDKSQARDALLGLLALQTDDVAAARLAGRVFRFAPPPADESRARGALLGLLARQTNGHAAAQLAGRVVELEPTAEDKRQARYALLRLLARQTDGDAAAQLAGRVVELGPTAEDKREVSAVLLRLLDGQDGGWAAAQLTGALVKLDPTAEDKHLARAVLLRLLPGQQGQWGAGPIADAMVELDPTTDNYREARNVLLRLLVGQAGSWWADSLVGALARLTPTAEDKCQVREALVRLLEGQGSGWAAARLTGALVLLDPTAEDKRLARKAVLRALGDQPTGRLAGQLAGAVIPIDPTVEDKRQARRALLGLLASESDGWVAQELAGVMVQLAPTADDKRHACDVLLKLLTRQPDSAAGPLAGNMTYLVGRTEKLAGRLAQLNPTEEHKRQARAALLDLIARENQLAERLAHSLVQLEPTASDLSTWPTSPEFLDQPPPVELLAAARRNSALAATRAGRALHRWLLTVAGVEPRGDPGHRSRLRAGQRRQLGRQRRSPRSEALLS
jgi:hypothetical protein